MPTNPQMQDVRDNRATDESVLSDVENMLVNLNNFKQNPWSLSTEQRDKLKTISREITNLFQPPNTL